AHEGLEGRHVAGRVGEDADREASMLLIRDVDGDDRRADRRVAHVRDEDCTAEEAVRQLDQAGSTKNDPATASRARPDMRTGVDIDQGRRADTLAANLDHAYRGREVD